MNEERLECELGADWLLVVHFDLEAEVLNHAPDFWGWLAWCREVAVHEDGVGWVRVSSPPLCRFPKRKWACCEHGRFPAQLSRLSVGPARRFERRLWSLSFFLLSSWAFLQQSRSVIRIVIDRPGMG